MGWRWTFAFSPLLSVALLSAQPAPGDPSLDEVLQRLGDYVASYGERASLIVAVEKHTQTIGTADGTLYRPRNLVAEIALLRTGGDGEWMGFRDVVEVNGKPLTDREDRLLRLLTDPSATLSEARRIADESSRFNVGPVMRNFNVPTTALFFLSRSNQPRFEFVRKRTKRIEGVVTWEIEFRETQRPTLVRTRAGRDVPAEGTVWVVPGDGTIVRTSLSLRGFADVLAMGEPRMPDGARGAPPAGVGPSGYSGPPPSSASPPAGQGAGGTAAGKAPPTGGTGGTGSGASPAPGNAGSTGATNAGSTGGATGAVVASGDLNIARRFPRRELNIDGASDPLTPTRLDSEATIDVSYKRHGAFGLWLPAKMTETYAGSIPRPGQPHVEGRARAVATYSDFRRFETSARIVEPPKL